MVYASADRFHRRVREVFDAIDSDGNGVLDRDEVAQATAKLQRPLFGRSLDQAMAAMDSDGDGVVTFTEFVEWWETGGKLSMSEQLELQWANFGRAFDRMTSSLLENTAVEGAVGLFGAK